MMALLKRFSFLGLLLGSFATTAILTKASFLDRAQLWFSPLAMIQRTTMTSRSKQLGQVELLRNNANYNDNHKKRENKANYETERRSLLEVHYGGSSLDSTALIFDNTPLWKSISTVCIANAVGCILSLVTGSHLHLDLLGTGAFGMAAVVAAQYTPKTTITIPRVRLSRTFVIIWSLKLASFLFFRILKNKHDARLDDLLSTTGGAVSFWFISALWGVICGLPHYIGLTSSDIGSKSSLFFGTAVYAAGLLIETLADYQKWTFKKSNPRKFCNVGLWSISQHPNFFGNMLIWGGIFILNAPSLIEPTSAVASASSSIVAQFWRLKRFGIALLSPLFMWTLFYGQASGLITNSVSLANLRYGDDPNYKKYVESVPLIIPRFFPFGR